MVITDADIIIEVFRKNPVALSFLTNNIGPYEILLSAVTVAEIQQGAQNKENLQQINKVLKQFIILPVDFHVSEIFSRLVSKYVLIQTLQIQW